MKETCQPLRGEEAEKLMTLEEIGGLTNQYLAVLRSAQGSPLMLEVAEDCVNQVSELLYSQNEKAEEQGQKVVLNVVLKKPVNLLANEERDAENKGTVLEGVRFIGFRKMPNKTTDSILPRWYIITERNGMHAPIQSFDPIDSIKSIEISEAPLKMPVAA